jgi:threonine synthase
LRSTPPPWTASIWKLSFPTASLSNIRSKKTVVTATHLGASYFEVFLRTLEQEIEDAWEPAVAVLGANPAKTPENFEDALKSFIAAHATTRDRHAFVQQLFHPTNPQDLSTVCWS